MPMTRCRGATLIEALVAVLVLALGVIGMAGLQLRTLVETRSSNAQAVAVQMADDLLERMAANPGTPPARPGREAYLVDFGAPTSAPDCWAQACAGDGLAAFDLRQWKTGLARLLPAGDGRVFRSRGDARQFGVLIRWSDASGGAAGNLGPDAATDPSAACPAGFRCLLAYIRP